MKKTKDFTKRFKHATQALAKGFEGIEQDAKQGLGIVEGASNALDGLCGAWADAKGIATDVSSSAQLSQQCLQNANSVLQGWPFAQQGSRRNLGANRDA